MPLRTDTRTLALIFLVAIACAGAPPGAQTILLMGDEPGPWKGIFSSVGLAVSQGNHLPPATLRAHVESGAFAIIEAHSDFGAALGIRPGRRRVPARSLIDVHNPKLPIVWEKPVDIPEYSLPAGAIVYSRERWTGIPLVAGIRSGQGAVLWTAVGPGAKGYERFPYLLQALVKLGLRMPLRTNRTWAFLDPAYRTRADIDYIADRWVRSGIGAIHVASWNYTEPDAKRDEWLRSVIAACHRRGILVYAWIELPHVSETFWNEHPEWREKTAVLQDAHLDWRKLMNLQNRDCFRAVSALMRGLLTRFDWDGVNLAELYFESLEGHANAARFTPMNDDIRREYRALTDIDPVTLFSGEARPEAMTAFLQYRAEVVRRMQGEWLGVVEGIRREQSHLDVVLTHVDDRFDTHMRDAIGADSAAVLPLLDKHDFTFLIEDPATVWHLGPERYSEIATRYKPLTPRQDRLAIDLNIVERYQDVYPTKQQTGTELFQLVHTAAAAFPRVALYFETSILTPDLDLLASASAVATRFERRGDKVVLDSPRGVGLAWSGGANVDGRPWPVSDGSVVWLPAGPHVVEPAELPPVRVERVTADLASAVALPDGVQFSYRSSARVYVRVSERIRKVEIDGEVVDAKWVNDRTLVLPRGQHIVSLTR
jgi:hypothetical protein